MTTDADKDLEAVLTYLVGRRLSAKEVLEALEMSRSSYYQHKETGKLATADNLIRAARNLGLNEIDLLVRYGLASPDAILDYVESEGLVGGDPSEATTARGGRNSDRRRRRGALGDMAPRADGSAM